MDFFPFLLMCCEFEFIEDWISRSFLIRLVLCVFLLLVRERAFENGYKKSEIREILQCRERVGHARVTDRDRTGSRVRWDQEWRSTLNWIVWELQKVLSTLSRFFLPILSDPSLLPQPLLLCHPIWAQMCLTRDIHHIKCLNFKEPFSTWAQRRRGKIGGALKRDVREKKKRSQRVESSSGSSEST